MFPQKNRARGWGYGDPPVVGGLPRYIGPQSGPSRKAKHLVLPKQLAFDPIGKSHEPRMPASSSSAVPRRLPQPLPSIISLAYDFTNVVPGCQGEGFKPEPSARGTKLGGSRTIFQKFPGKCCRKPPFPRPVGVFRKEIWLNLLSREISGNRVNFLESPSSWRLKEWATGLPPSFLDGTFRGNMGKTFGEAKFTGKANYPGGKPGPLSLSTSEGGVPFPDSPGRVGLFETPAKAHKR